MVSSMFVIATALFLSAPQVSAKSVNSQEWETSHRHSGSLEVSLNPETLILGGAYRFSIIPRMRMGLYTSFSMTPQERTVTDQIRPRYFVQRKERRYLASAGIDKRFFLSEKVDLFVRSGVGYTFADFAGTDASPRDGWTPMFNGGLILKFRDIDHSVQHHLRVGLQYADRRLQTKYHLQLAYEANW